MFRAQIADGEGISCADYDVGDHGVTLYDSDQRFLAFVPYTNLLWMGRVDDDGLTVW